MPIAAADLIAYEALTRADDDASVIGGAIDPDHRIVFTQLAANDSLEAVSTSASDTQTITVVGRNAAGAKITNNVALTGTTAVTIPGGVHERVLRCSIPTDAVGTITLRRITAGPTVGTIPPGERGFHAAFVDSASESGIAIRYHKIHWKNTHGTLTLNGAAVKLTADPDARIRMGVHTAKGDSATIATRKTAPGGITFVDDNVSQSVPTGVLAAAENIGVWIEQNLPATDAPHRTTYTTELSGTTV